eukprot:CAMPEP_0202916542 /NCGR_PEP_ID=MMETSP1392-20130828/68798_1 /ASSEMBLY_ACC=CAM_ASM_000868 /TAXON_ID=225041 /ORGANISM="Chlamydomonas chlamydogama, Strain SAG 11-48b" /LENGTH=42 /DNA_ID= /DNA_START= /DNA_END= /DNA_ORIENTATION=
MALGMRSICTDLKNTNAQHTGHSSPMCCAAGVLAAGSIQLLK